MGGLATILAFGRAVESGARSCRNLVNEEYNTLPLAKTHDGVMLLSPMQLVFSDCQSISDSTAGLESDEWECDCACERRPPEN